MSRKALGAFLTLAGAALTLSGPARAQGWWNPDYTHRVPLTITNPAGGTQPTANITAEATIGVPTEARADAKDIRVVYWSGSAWQELDRQIFSEAPRYSITENLNAGKTDYASLPTGTKLVLSGLDNGQAEVTMPFNFTYGNVTSNKLLVGSDGQVFPGGSASDPYFRPDSPSAAAGARLIAPYVSDFDTTPGGVWVDLQPTQVTVRWEVAASGGSNIIAKFALILYPNNSVRFVYGSPCLQDTTICTWSTVEYGVGLGAAGSSKITEVTNVDMANHPDITYSGMESAAPGARIVFRLAAPLADGATSTGQYFLYYGNPSPTEPPAEPKNIYDAYIDAGADAIGQPASQWESQEDNSTEVGTYLGKKVILLKKGTVSHPRWIVKKGAMPNFLNAELFTQFAGLGGENEFAAILRCVNDPNNSYPDPNRAYSGGLAYASDGWGSQQGVCSYINPTVEREPADFGLTTFYGKNDDGVVQNMLFRLDGTVLSGKKWSVVQTEPTGFVMSVDRATANPQHLGETDPLYDKPGGTGFASYNTNTTALFFTALRELLTNTTVQSVASNTPTGPWIQGTITSSNAALNPLTVAKVHITGPGGYDQTFYVGPQGQYRVTLPEGTGPYTVEVSAPYHTTKTVSAVPTTTESTNVVLPYVGAQISGRFIEALTLVPQAGAKIVLISSDGYNIGQTTTDANGNYSILAPTGGDYYIGGMGATGVGDRKPASVASGGNITVNLAGGIPSNGDCEIPNATNTAPMDWSNGNFGTATAYVYSREQNHTPGGHWSVSIVNGDAAANWNPPPSAFYTLPIQADAFNVDVVAWVYFTQPGQEVRLRLRNNWPNQPVIIVSGEVPPANQMNQGGLDANGKVPVGQWYEIRARHLVTDGALDGNGIAYNLYQYRGNGTVYFDDTKVEQTPIAKVEGRLLDEAGQPVSGGYVGVMGNTENYTLIGPVAKTDPEGRFIMYATTTGNVTIGGWKPALPGTGGVMPAYDYLLSTATANAQPAGGTPVTLRVSRAGNVAKGASATCKTLDGIDCSPSQWPYITDDNYNTRNDSGGDKGADIVYTVDLGSVKSIDQIEVFWELARPLVYAVSVGPDMGSLEAVYDTTTGSNEGILNMDITPFAEGPMVIHRFPTAKSIRYIVINCAGFTSGLGNYSIIDIRALSTAVQPPLEKIDVAKALAIAGGLVQATSADIARLDKTGDGKVTLADADRIARTVAGL